MCTTAILGACIAAGAFPAVSAGHSPRANPAQGLVAVGTSPAAGLGKVHGRVPSSRTIRVDFFLRQAGALPGPGGASRAAYERRLAIEATPVEQYVLRFHLHAHRLGPEVRVQASAGRLSSLLHVHFATYREAGTLVYASSTPELPAAVASRIEGVLGLSDAPVATAATLLGRRIAARSRPRTVGDERGLMLAQTSTPTPCAEVQSALAPGDYSMLEVGAHYGVSSLLSAGQQGQGVTVAVVGFAASNPTDIAHYDACFGIDFANYSAVAVGTGGTGSDSTEPDLDIEQIQTQAPLARVVSYEAPNSAQGFADALTPIVTADTAKVISISWGACETDYSPSDRQSIDSLLAQAASQGQSVFVAAGDSGSEDCTNSSGGAALGVDFPGSDPNVTAVGGTVMSDTAPGSPDSVWNDGTSGGAGGGGLSAEFPEPAAQSAGAGALSGRGVPDVSAAAKGIVFYSRGAGTTPTWWVADGTSFAAPFMAGMVADLQSSCASAIGSFAPKLYTWYRTAGYGSGFTDVTTGNNDWTGQSSGTYTAGPGYDLASGIGTPIASGLACPQVVGLSSGSEPAGASLTISGSNLENVTSVDFGTAAAEISARSATSLVVTVPSGLSGSVSVDVSNPTGDALVQPRFSVLPPPAITSADTDTVTSGQAFSFTVQTSGFSATPALSETGPLPAGTSFHDNGNGTAVIAGTVSTGRGGSVPLELSASDGTDSATQAFHLVVDDAPAISGPSTIHVALNAAANVVPTLTGYPAPSLSVSAGSLPSGLTLAGGVLSGTPTAAGSYPVTLSAANTAGSTSFATTIVVASGPTFSTGSPSSVTYTIGQASSATLSASGSPTPSIALSDGALPGGLTATASGATLTIAGTPLGGTAGHDTVTVTGTNSTGATDRTLGVDVDEPPSLSPIDATSWVLEVDQQASYVVTGAGGYPAPTYSSSGQLPAGVTFDPTTGTFSGVARTSGTYPVTVSAANVAGTASAQLSIVVRAPAGTPSAGGNASSSGGSSSGSGGGGGGALPAPVVPVTTPVSPVATQPVTPGPVTPSPVFPTPVNNPTPVLRAPVVPGLGPMRAVTLHGSAATLTVSCPRACVGTLGLRLGKTVLASRRFVLRPSRWTSLAVRIPQALVAKLRQEKKATLVVVEYVTVGHRSLRRRLVLHLPRATR